MFRELPNRAPRPLALLWLATSLAACVDYRPAPLVPQATAASFNARRLDDPALVAAARRLLPDDIAPWPPATWNRAELFAVALAQNPELAVAHARVDAARAGEVAAAQRPNPNLTLESEYARHDMRPWLYGFAVDWPLANSHQHRLVQSIAQLETVSQTLELMEQTWVLRRQLIDALSRWQAATQGLDLEDKLAAAEAALIAITRNRVTAGEEAPSALVPLEQARLDSDTERVQWRTRAAVAQAETAAALGLTATALDGIRIDWSDWGSPPSLSNARGPDARERALLSRIDLQRVMRDYDIAERRLELAVARQYPQIAIGPGYYWDHGIAKFPLDLGVSLPLNRNKGEIAEAHAARELTARRMFAVQADIVGAIDAAERGESLARDGLVAAEGRLLAARQQMARSGREVQGGWSGRDQTLAATIVALRAELAVLEARAELQSARNRLEDAIHAPLSGPELSLVPGDPELAVQ